MCFRFGFYVLGFAVHTENDMCAEFTSFLGISICFALFVDLHIWLSRAHAAAPFSQRDAWFELALGWLLMDPFRSLFFRGECTVHLPD